LYKKKPGRPKKFDSKDIVINVRLSKKEYGRLRNLADEKEVSISSTIRMLINEYWTA
jgi:hypothetical protein